MAKKKEVKPRSEKLTDFIYMNSWNEKGASKAFIEKLCGELLEYYANPSKLTLKEFLAENNIAWQTFAGWRKKHEILESVVSQVKLILAARREKGMYTGELREKPIMYSQYLVDPEWSEADQRWHEMRKKEHVTTVTDFIPYLEAIEVDDGSGRRIVKKFVEGKPVDDNEEEE